MSLVIERGDITTANSFDIGLAVIFLKEGFRVARKGWNGKGMYIIYMRGYPDGVPCNKPTAEALGIKEGDNVVINPYFMLKCADGSYSSWVPSVSDSLAEDWYVVE